MQTKTSLPKQAALITAIILGSSAWVSAQTSQGPSGQRSPGTSSGTTGQRYSDPSRQPGTTASEQTATSPTTQPMKINKGSSLIGATVKNQQGETLGKIKDIVVDLSSEKVAYAVLDTGTGAFSTQKLHAVPLRAFQTDAEGTSLILNADKQKAAQAEGFDKNNWPAMNSAAWGAEPFWKESEGTTTAPRSTESDRQNRDTTKEGSKSQPQNQP